MVWDRETGRADPPRYRLAGPPNGRRMRKAQAAEGAEAMVQTRTGLLLDPYFSATKIAWILDHVAGARARAERGELACGTIDSFLLWRLTGGAMHATDVTNAGADITVRHSPSVLGQRTLPLVPGPGGTPSRGARQQPFLRDDRARSVRRAAADRRTWPATSRPPCSAKPASRRHDQVDLRHRLLHAREYGRATPCNHITGC